MPVIVAVDSDPGALADVERELRDRYARHYRIECLSSPGDALDLLGELAAAGGEVALVLAGCTLRGTTGSELLDRVRTLHPHAKRGLLIAWGQWGDRDTGEAIFTAIARGQVDHYMLRPMAAPDEAFHQAVTSSLLDWAEARRTSPYTIHIIGEAWSGRAYELRRTLGRCAIPHSFCLADSDEGRAHMAAVGDAVPLPVVVFPDGTVLTDPSDAEIALAAGSPVAPERLEFDLVIIGAGPAGLSAAVYGASEGFATLVVDEGGVGGQATSSSLIRNYLGFPRGISGRQLAQRAYNQAWIFGAKFAFMRRALGVARDGDDVVVSLSGEARVRSRAVLLATGATYHRLAVQGTGGAARRGCVLRTAVVGGARDDRARCVRTGRRQLRRAGRAVPRPVRPHHDDRGPRGVAGGRDVAVPDRGDRGHAKTARAHGYRDHRRRG